MDEVRHRQRGRLEFVLQARPSCSERPVRPEAIGCAPDPHTAKLSYQKRHNSAGYIYIAGSKSAKLLKVGTCVDIEQRRRNLWNQYGGISNWEMLFTAKVDAGGTIEGDILTRLSMHKVVRVYEKDGKKQEAAEMLKTWFSVALATVQDRLKGINATEIRKALNLSTDFTAFENV